MPAVRPESPLNAVAGINKVNNLSLPPFPDLILKNLSPADQQSLADFNDAVDKYVDDLERILNERLQPRAPRDTTL